MMPKVRVYRKLMLFVVMVSIIWFFGAVQSFSEEGCEQRSVLGDLNVRPRDRFGEFEFKLNPPGDFGAISVQTHFAFSHILAKLLIDELPRRTNRLCHNVTTAIRFPDLHVYLYSRRPSGPSATDQALCEGALESLLRVMRPSRNAISGITSGEAETKRQLLSNPPGPWMEMGRLVRLALTNIYHHDTVMHALVTADLDHRLFQSLDVDAFFYWLEKQRSFSGDRLIRIKVCNPDETREGSQAEKILQKFPSSAIMLPGALHLSVKRDKSALAQQTLPIRYFVIVGNNKKLGYVPARTPVTDKLCNMPYSIPRDKDYPSDQAASVMIRCKRELFYGVGDWIAILCDPNDCRSDRVARVVMETIANDPDVLELARDSGEPLRGPYLIDVDVTYE
jgi:hypothetical protein